MCFDHDSRPPIAPIEGGSLDAKDLVLEAADGNRFMAYQARAAEPDGSAIVVLPDVRGLHAYYRDLALRFAEHGTEAVAIDYFGRTAGIGDRGPASTTSRTCRRRPTRAARRHRRRGGPAPVDDRGDAPVHRRVLHGRPAGVPDRRVRPRAGRRDRLLRLADRDRAATARPRRRMSRTRSRRRSWACSAARTRASTRRCAGRSRPRCGPRASPTSSSTYDNAPHSFFDRKADEFTVTSAKAWDEVLGFIRGGLAA